jgi:acyl-coenzyme A synthetase/AMP-(fatty) acid ligase
MGYTPLLSHRSADAIVCYRGGQAVSARQFLSHVGALAALLPPGRHVLNVCADRYRFAVGLAACLLSGRVSLLPSTHTPEVIGHLTSFAPDVFCLTDDARCDIGLPQLFYPDEASLAAAAREADVQFAVPKLPDDQLAAIVFTSGSTGRPLPYEKRWGPLSSCVLSGAQPLGLLDGRLHTLIGTVPAQHMYGFESTVLLALLSGNAFGAERPFYPADIAATMNGVPRPRILVSTPIHLRALLASEIEFPAVDLVLSATAPLTQELARAVEARYRTRLLEIYGSTETGQIALRRSAQSAAWRLWPGVRLTQEDQQTFAQGGHIEQKTLLCDLIELTAADEFLLHGRTADLVNVAGKRSSFAYLNAQLNAIPGVLDGAFFLRDSTGDTGVARLGAAVVAPSLNAGGLTEQLRRRIDPVFLPRPLLMVERLPRNATGKLPQQALQELADRQLRSESLPIAANHPCYAGHFPHHPVFPGAGLMDEALAAIQRARGIDLTEWQIAGAKFIDMVKPGDAPVVEHESAHQSLIRFTIRVGSRAVVTGTLAKPQARASQ